MGKRLSSMSMRTSLLVALAVGVVGIVRTNAIANKADAITTFGY